jgi:hypothetical protein
VPYGKTAESTDFYTLALFQGGGHRLENAVNYLFRAALRDFGALRYRVDELRFGHRGLPISFEQYKLGPC